MLRKSAVLTRREIEGQLRSLQPVAPVSLSRRRAILRARKVARAVIVTMLGLSFVVGFGAASLLDTSRPPTVVRQWASWGVEHVEATTVRTRSNVSFFPAAKRHRASAYQARQSYLRRQGRVVARRAAIDRYY
jgi:hypothetical protein